ncbi:IS1182 family transposase [Patescibacteria group bacterium]|nr:IS1182 family transposase [Patescibacteria group bacterium]
MKYIIGQDRNQTAIFPLSMEAAIDQDNEVRIIDLFVDSLDVEKMGFRVDSGENGRPAYHPKDLLKLYIYGYLNRVRTSRELEKETKRNIEVIWLMKGLSPDHNTISNFRRDNPKAIKKVFRSTVAIAKNFELIGGKLLAGDSTKLRAQNSKKNNFNEKKIERHLEYIESKLSEYENQLSAADEDKRKLIKQEIEKHQARKQTYQELQMQLEKTGEKQISTSDPESRQMITRNNITEVAYNVQTTVDAENNIPIDYKVTNENDSKAMGGMVRRTKTILGHSDFTTLYDKGYHTGSEFDYAHKQEVEVIVAVPAVASHAPDHAFDVEQFDYNKEKDSYTCPANETLTTNGRWYNKSRGKSINKIKQYTTKACKNCELCSRCTSNKGGRMIERSEHAELIATNKIRHDQNKTLYRRRQAIVEHPYGTIKRQWGFNYIITKKTIKRAEADVGLIFTAYNLRRILNIIGIEVLRKYFLLVVMLKRAFFSSLEAFWQQKILITKIVTQKQTMLRNKIFANFRQLFYGKLNYSGGY